MTWSWFGQFFGAFPEALRVLYEFGDPASEGRGWWGFLILGIWAVAIVAVPLGVAKLTYGKHEWISATMGALGGLGILWWVFGILPSAWVYFVDSNEEILENSIIPTSLRIPLGGDRYLPVATDLYEVLRDVGVVIEHVIALGAVVWAALAIQRRFPRRLVPGEERLESGGYR